MRLSLLEGGIQVIGRIDRDSFRFYRKERMPLDSLMAKVDIQTCYSA